MRSAKTAGTYRRGAAVVELDSVVERASALVLVSAGSKLNANAKLDDYISNLVEVLKGRWKPKSLFDVRQLRRARNSAQHEALEPDRENMPIWARVTEQFSVSLIQAAFEVDLRRVVLSDAIARESSREQLAAAERAFETGDYKQCVDLSMGVYKEAVKEWKKLTKQPDRSWDNGASNREHSERIRHLEATSEASTFAVDEGEAEWFSRALTDAVSAELSHLFDREDAARVLSFTFTWVLGFERASDTWVADRYYRAAAAARSVRTGDEPVRIASFEIQKRTPWETSATFVLADVPPAGTYETWASTLRDLLGVVLGEYQWSVRLDGTVNVIRMGTKSGSLVDDTRRLIAALAEVEATITAREKREREVEARVAMLAENDRKALAQFSFPDWVDLISRDAELYPADNHRWVIFVEHGVRTLKMQEDRLLSSVIAVQENVTECSDRWDGGLGISPFLSVPELQVLLWSIDPLVKSAVARDQQAEKERVDTIETLRVDIEFLLRAGVEN
ncbi:MAG: hypothetical protein JWM49_1090 [Microbacteriaceae bacterium]|nr:hypothetical protein [Microbacteriaceae bacterium]